MRTRQLQGIFISDSWSDSLGRFWPHCTMVIYDAAAEFSWADRV
ncbi:hypothetical protein [Loigolactobacillus coryniformis]|nr:hypothetical protein [Loigolactobacillus coryniformis]